MKGFEKKKEKKRILNRDLSRHVTLEFSTIALNCGVVVPLP